MNVIWQCQASTILQYAFVSLTNITKYYYPSLSSPSCPLIKVLEVILLQFSPVALQPICTFILSSESCPQLLEATTALAKPFVAKVAILPL